MVSTLNTEFNKSRVTCCAMLLLSWPCSFAQQPGAASSPPAILSQSVAAMIPNGTGLTDITLQGNVEYTSGITDLTGTITLKATSDGSIRIDLSLPTGTMSESVVFANGQRTGQRSDTTGAIVPTALHNLFVDAAWFSPALVMQQFNSSWTVIDLGPVMNNGISLESFTSTQPGLSGDPNINSALGRLSTMQFMLDPSTGYPNSLLYGVHPDNDSLTTNQQITITYANYQNVGGVVAPTHIQKIVNGVMQLDISVTSVAINSGLNDAQFALQS